jgi:hypothetical protein
MLTGNTCHILPCSIDEDMTAHTAKYFHLTALKDTSDNDVKTMAAQYRGRGLLCVADDDIQQTDDSNIKVALSTLPEGMKGVTLAPSPHVAKKSDGDTTRSLKLVETFSKVYNWQHEHDVDKVRRLINEGGHNNIGLRAVLGWCDIAHAVSAQYDFTIASFILQLLIYLHSLF